MPQKLLKCKAKKSPENFQPGIVKGMPDMVLHNTLRKSVFYTCKMCKMCETSKKIFWTQNDFFLV